MKQNEEAVLKDYWKEEVSDVADASDVHQEVEAQIQEVLLEEQETELENSSRVEELEEEEEDDGMEGFDPLNNRLLNDKWEEENPELAV